MRFPILAGVLIAAGVFSITTPEQPDRLILPSSVIPAVAPTGIVRQRHVSEL